MGRSIFASRTQETIAIPFDPPQTVTLRAMTGRECDRAQNEHLKAITTGQGGRGWAGTFQRRLQAGLATDADAAALIADPLAGFDRYAIVSAGLVAWSYDLSVNPEAIADLDDEAIEFFAMEILRRTKPDLFRTAPEAEAARKNG